MRGLKKIFSLVLVLSVLIVGMGTNAITANAAGPAELTVKWLGNGDIKVTVPDAVFVEHGALLIEVYYEGYFAALAWLKDTGTKKEFEAGFGNTANPFQLGEGVYELFVYYYASWGVVISDLGVDLETLKEGEVITGSATNFLAWGLSDEYNYTEPKSSGWRPSTPEEKYLYSLKVEAVEVAEAVSDADYDVSMKSEMQGQLFIDAVNLVVGDYEVAGTYNVFLDEKLQTPEGAVKIVMNIPERLLEEGRTFIMIGVDEEGVPHVCKDLDTDDATITFNMIGGYAYALCYFDK